MPSSDDTVRRLVTLEQMLAQTTSATTVGADATEVLLKGIPVERIRRLTAELKATPSLELNAVDAIVLRVLLNEYSGALAHLRAVAQMASATVDGAVIPLRRARRALHRYHKALGLTPESPDQGAQK